MLEKATRKNIRRGKISKKEYDAANARINEAESIVNEADQQIKDEQGKVNSAKEDLNKASGNASAPKRN